MSMPEDEALRQAAGDLARELASVAAALEVAACVTVRSDELGLPLVEVCPTRASSAPVMAVALEDPGSAFVKVDLAGEEVFGRPDSIVRACSAIAADMFQGHLEQTVVRSHSGKVLSATMRRRRGKPFLEIWTHPWPSIYNLVLRRRRTRQMLAPYPRA